MSTGEAAIMAIGGVIEIFFGINAERKSLEDVTKPLTSVPTEDMEALAARGGGRPGLTSARIVDSSWPLR